MLGSIRMAMLVAIAIGAASPVWGQGAHQKPSQVPRYVPATPTVSPYVSLLNRNGGGVASNYYGLIRPLQRQAAINARQTQTASTQEQELKSVQEQQTLFEQPTVKPTGTAGWFQTMGPTSPYQVSSHYYGQWQTGKAPKKRH